MAAVAQKSSFEFASKFQHKNPGSMNRTGILFVCLLYQSVVLADLGEAVAAVNRTIALGLERNLGLAAAGSASSGEQLAGGAGSVLAGSTASLALLGLVLEAAGSVELLLTGGENELLAALVAN